MSSRRRSLWSAGAGLLFNENDETRDRIASLEEAGDLFQFLDVEGKFKDRVQEMKRLAPEKVHGAEGFQKQGRRRSHTPLHHGIGYALKQFKILERKSPVFRPGRKSVGQIPAELMPILRETYLGEGSHKYLERQLKADDIRHYTKGSKESQLKRPYGALGFACVPPGAILPRFAGWKPSGIPAATVLRPWCFSQFQLSSPNKASADPSLLR
jgi:hypothetical protein